jgi:dTDP-glucose 4,6-dehydratase
MRYFLTGGAGFIGSNFARWLLNSSPRDLKISVYDSFTYAANKKNLEVLNAGSRLTVVEGDIRDARKLEQSMADHDVVVHFAAESHVDRSIQSGHIFVDTNVLGSFNVFQSALNLDVPRVIHVSTDEVYGSLRDGSADEKYPLAPNSPYAASKAASDLVARSFVETYGLDIRITRCCNNYGPNQHMEKLIPLLISKIRMGENLPIYGDGTNIREWIHVLDHCRAIGLVLSHGEKGQIYNVGSGIELTNLELAKSFIASSETKKSKIEFIADRKGHDFRYSLNSQKIRGLGFAPEYNIKQDIQSGALLNQSG